MSCDGKAGWFCLLIDLSLFHILTQRNALSSPGIRPHDAHRSRTKLHCSSLSHNKMILLTTSIDSNIVRPYRDVCAIRVSSRTSKIPHGSNNEQAHFSNKAGQQHCLSLRLRKYLFVVSGIQRPTAAPTHASSEFTLNFRSLHPTKQKKSTSKHHQQSTW